MGKPSPGRVIKAFEQAIKVFNRQDFSRARAAFENVIEKFPDEPEVAARARAYIAICQRRLSQRPPTPRTAEALYDRGVIELNRCQFLLAISFFEKALKLEPEADHVIYALAAALAKAGQVERAIAELKRCIQMRDLYRIQARHDPDFRGLYSNEEFQNLIGMELIK